MKKGRFGWPVVWAIQTAIMLGCGAAVALTEWLGAGVYAVAAWVLMPAAGAVSAYRATRRGLLNYAAWLAPPLGFLGGNWICWGYSPDPGPALLCAFISLVGAAAGEVVNRQIKH